MRATKTFRNHVLNSYSALAHSFFVDPFIFACTVEILVEILQSPQKHSQSSNGYPPRFVRAGQIHLQQHHQVLSPEPTAFHTGLAGWDANISRSLLHQMLLRTVLPWHDLSEAEYQVNAQDMRAASTVKYAPVLLGAAQFRAKHQLISSRSFTCFSRCKHCKQAKIRLRPQNKPSSLERKSGRKAGCQYMQISDL